MTPELFAIGFLSSAVYGAYHLSKDVMRRTGSFRIQSPFAWSRRTAGPGSTGVTAGVRQAAHNVQVGLMQVREAPDFRRAASFVSQAADVPVWFRQRQYHRFRSLLVEHLSRLLNEGASCDSLMPGLTQLVTGLGIAPFEADYIRTEAEARLTRQGSQPPDFGQRLREAQSVFRSRMRTLESLSELDDETREQLMEQEKSRFQEQMRTISGGGAGHEP